MPLQTTYRPKSFKQFYGNEQTVETIKAAINQEDHNHCMLITGPSGCGKTTLARIVARALGAYNPASVNNPCFIEINNADNRGVDTVRAIRDECSRVPLGGEARVFFFDECHQQTRVAQEMFLKLLEEADGYNYFIFATTNPEMLLDTFKRRCAQYTLQPLSEKDVADYIANIADKEQLDIDDAVFEHIASQSTGSIGIALGILDAIKALPGEKIMDAIASAAESQSQAIELCRALAKPTCKWKDIQPILKSLKQQGEDAEGIRRMVLGYCSSWLLNKDEPRAWLIMDAFREPMYNIGFPGIVLASYTALPD